MRRFSLVHAGSLILFLLFLSCKQAESPEFLGLDEFRVSKFSPQGPTLSANLHFFNPNSFSLQLKKADVNYYFNDNHAGHSVLDTTIDIPRRDSFFVPASVQVDMHSLFSNALQFLVNKQVVIRVEGKLVLKRSGIRFTVPIQYTQTQNLDSLLPSGF